MRAAGTLRVQELFHVLQMNDDMTAKLTETISYFSETNTSLLFSVHPTHTNKQWIQECTNLTQQCKW